MIAHHFGGDRPVESVDEDRLGFAESATHLADVILRFASPEGFVLGLEGPWGSGKSSYINLIIAALRRAGAPPETVKFSPWLISSRDGLLAELFREIGQAALQIDLVPDEEPAPDDVWQRLRTPMRAADRAARRKKLARSLNGFADNLSRAGKLAEVAEALGVPYAGLAKRGMDAASQSAKALAKAPSLEAEKESLKTELRKLSRKIVVFIDDLDRLEPVEASEVVRLVRAVADFPNIVYVLCYSRAVLAQSLASALALTDGVAYVDKIVQVEFTVPRPEDFDLRRMFRADIEALFPEALRESESAEGRLRLQRLASAIDIEGGKSLSTPRDVVRAINALRLYAGPVIERIDLPDMVWLQLIRLKNADLYAWIENYVNNLAAIVGGARVRDGEAAHMMQRLKSLLSKEGNDVDDQIADIAQILLGIRRGNAMAGSDNESWTLFQDVGHDDLAARIADRRLCSPHHFRLYFALAKPSGALDDADFEQFMANAAAHPEAAAEFLQNMANVRRPQGGLMAEAIIARLEGNGIRTVPQEALPGLIRSLVRAMDVAARNTSPGDFGHYGIWDSASRVFKAALPRLTQEQRSALMPDIFEHGASLGWITYILRHEIFNHGRYGNRQKPENERLLTPVEFDAAVAAMQTRYAATDPDALMKTPYFLNLLFAWLQSNAKGEADVKQWVAERIRSDAAFLQLLEGMRSWGASGGEIYYPLKADNLGPFLDYKAARKRVEYLQNSDDSGIADHAKRLVTAFVQGEDE